MEAKQKLLLLVLLAVQAVHVAVLVQAHAILEEVAVAHSAAPTMEALAAAASNSGHYSFFYYNGLFVK